MEGISAGQGGAQHPQISSPAPIAPSPPVSLVIQWDEIHEQDVVGQRIQPRKLHLKGWEHPPAQGGGWEGGSPPTFAAPQATLVPTCLPW